MSRTCVNKMSCWDTHPDCVNAPKCKTLAMNMHTFKPDGTIDYDRIQREIAACEQKCIDACTTGSLVRKVMTGSTTNKTLIMGIAAVAVVSVGMYFIFKKSVV